jgi:hypothetical protein
MGQHIVLCDPLVVDSHFRGFLDTNIERSTYLDKVKFEVEARALATMINHGEAGNQLELGAVS